MIPYAYRTGERKKEDIIYACDAIQSDINKSYFCPNNICNAELHICSMNGTVKPYFRATKKGRGHVEGCLYLRDSANCEGKYNKSTFSFENAIDAMMVDSNNAKTKKRYSVDRDCTFFGKPLHTIAQIYSICKSHYVTYVYGDKKICEMLLDDRSIYFYSKGCWGKHIVEGKFKSKFYDNDKQMIYVTAPINSDKYTFELCLPNEELYKDVRKQVFNNRTHYLIVAADWQETGVFNVFRGVITTKKQYKIL